MLKLSGEALMGDQEFGIDLNTINAITEQIIYVLKKRNKSFDSCGWRKYF